MYFVQNSSLRSLVRIRMERHGFSCVYTKKMGEKPDFVEPVVLSEARGGITLNQFAEQLHAELPKQLKYALVWGYSTKHMGQRCGLNISLWMKTLCK